MSDFLMFLGFCFFLLSIRWLLDLLVKSLQIELLTKIMTMLKDIALLTIQGYGIYAIWQIIKVHL